MSVPFSEDLWQRLSGLWRRDKKEEEEAVGYDDPQLKQMLDVMMVSRRSMKAAEKQNANLSVEMENLRNEIEVLRRQNEVLNQERGQFLYELLETRKSITYKVGRFITFLPRKLRNRK